MSRRWFTVGLLVAAACGGAPGGDPAEAAAEARKPSGNLKAVVPDAVELAPGQVQAFAVVPASTRVTWAVAEAGGGTITSTGLYTAPGAGGTYHVVATSVAQPGVSRSATVTVPSPVSITAPSPIAMDACTTVLLAATVTGSADTGVIWSVPDPSCGSITPAGDFTAARGDGTCTAVAAARADPSQTATVTLQIAERVLSVAVDPPTATVTAGGAQQFTATVTTTCGAFPASTVATL